MRSVASLLRSAANDVSFKLDEQSDAKRADAGHTAASHRGCVLRVNEGQRPRELAVGELHCTPTTNSDPWTAAACGAPSVEVSWDA